MSVWKAGHECLKKDNIKTKHLGMFAWLKRKLAINKAFAKRLAEQEEQPVPIFKDEVKCSLTPLMKHVEQLFSEYY